MGDEWNSMGCRNRNDEFECTQALGQAAADAMFQRHWGSWITQEDINLIKSYGLNMVRIPLGFGFTKSLSNLVSSSLEVDFLSSRMSAAWLHPRACTSS